MQNNGSAEDGEATCELATAEGTVPIANVDAVGDSSAEQAGMDADGHIHEEDIAEGYDDEDEGEEADEPMATSDDEEYNLTHFGISQALPVPDGLPDLTAGPPQTAEEYLQWVRFEASQCPRVTRKDVDPAKMEQREKRQQQQREQKQQEQQRRRDEAAAAAGAGPGGDNPGPRGGGGGGGGGSRWRGGTAFAAQVPPPVTSSCEEWARPSAKWLRVFLQDFSRLRHALSGMQRHHARELSVTQLPHLNNTGDWDRLCFEQWQPMEQPLEQPQQQPQPQQPQLEESGRAPEQPTQQPQQQQQQPTGGDDVRTGADEADEAQAPPPPPPPQDADGDAELGSSPRKQQKQKRGLQKRGHGGDTLAPGDGGPGAGVGGDTDRLSGPVVRTVLALDQVSVGYLIQRHVTQLASQPCLSYIRSQWLFALTAVLERPVPPDVAAAMRDLVRRCSAWRASLECPEDPALPRLNVLLAVAGGYFGQDEHLSAAAAAAGLKDMS